MLIVCVRIVLHSRSSVGGTSRINQAEITNDLDFNSATLNIFNTNGVHSVEYLDEVLL